MQADVRVTLADAGGGTTRLDYDADAVVGGMIGGVGQRVLTGVAKKTAGEFFKAVDDVLTGKAPATPSLPRPERRPRTRPRLPAEPSSPPLRPARPSPARSSCAGRCSVRWWPWPGCWSAPWWPGAEPDAARDSQMITEP